MRTSRRRMKGKTKRTALLCAALLLAGASTAVLKAQESTGSVNDGVYSGAQAERGKSAYAKNCQSCHGEALTGIDVAPPLVGGTFLGNWTGQTLGDLASRIRTTMPLNNPGSLGSASVADIIAHVLRVNGYAAGISDLPRDVQVLQMIRIDSPKSAN